MIALIFVLATVTFRSMKLGKDLFKMFLMLCGHAQVCSGADVGVSSRHLQHVHCVSAAWHTVTDRPSR